VLRINILEVLCSAMLPLPPALPPPQSSPEGQIIWVAPSGGRDRPDPATGESCTPDHYHVFVPLCRKLCVV
jgi:hypothetical protein